MHTQLAVLGGGPGGYAAAFLAADLGMQATIVESQDRLGGTCLLAGCIPSKALLHVARVISEVDLLRDEWGVEYDSPRINLERIRQRKEKLITTLSGGLGQLAKRRKVNVVRARGSLTNSTTLELAGDDASIPAEKQLTFDHLILATGSRPVMPPALAIDSPRVMDSTAALNLQDAPQSLLVVGGGYIGLELATVYAQLGSQVSVVELTEGLLPGVDRDLVKPLQKRLAALLGNRIHLETKVASLVDTGDAVHVTLETGGQTRTEQFDRVLVAVGRRPNSDQLGLENTQASCDEQGFVVCDDRQRTADPHILAIGDLAGQPMLAHKATYEAKIAIESLNDSPSHRPLAESAIPAVVFTDPEIAWVGLTQDQAKQQQREVALGIYPWAASGRAHAMGRPEGLTKWLIDPGSEKVLGCGIVGVGAGELIAEAALAIDNGCKMSDVTHTIHPHPTMNETLANAGEVFYGTATEIYKPKRR